MKTPFLILCGLLLCGCVNLAPVSVAWRSNSHQQHATTEGRTDTRAGGDSVNADKTTETNASVATGAATANGAAPK